MLSMGSADLSDICAKVQHALALAQSGEIGEVWQVRYRAAHQGPKEMGASEHFCDWLYDPNRNGGGGSIAGGEATLTDCILAENTASLVGGGMHVDRSRREHSPSGGDGGGDDARREGGHREHVRSGNPNESVQALTGRHACMQPSQSVLLLILISSY